MGELRYVETRFAGSELDIAKERQRCGAALQYRQPLNFVCGIDADDGSLWLARERSANIYPVGHNMHIMLAHEHSVTSLEKSLFLLLFAF